MLHRLRKKDLFFLFIYAWGWSWCVTWYFGELWSWLFMIYVDRWNPPILMWFQYIISVLRSSSADLECGISRGDYTTGEAAVASCNIVTGDWFITPTPQPTESFYTFQAVHKRDVYKKITTINNRDLNIWPNTMDSYKDVVIPIKYLMLS